MHSRSRRSMGAATSTPLPPWRPSGCRGVRSAAERYGRGVIEDWVNVGDAAREGLEKLEQGPRAYSAGGAGDELTLRENAATWAHWRLRPRVLNDVRGVSTRA